MRTLIIALIQLAFSTHALTRVQEGNEYERKNSTPVEHNERVSDKKMKPEPACVYSTEVQTKSSGTKDAYIRACIGEVNPTVISLLPTINEWKARSRRSRL